MSAKPIDKFAAGDVIADDLWCTNDCCLQSRCALCDECCFRLSEYGVCLAKTNCDIAVLGNVALVI